MIVQPTTLVDPTRALEGEGSADEEAAKIFVNADAWLNHPHALLGGRTPQKCIDDGDEYLVRDLLRQIRFIGHS